MTGDYPSFCLQKKKSEPQRKSAKVSEPQQTSANLSKPQQTLANLSGPHQKTSENLGELWRTLTNHGEPLQTSASVSERHRTTKNFESTLEDILVQIRSHPKLLGPLRTLEKPPTPLRTSLCLTESHRTCWNLSALYGTLEFFCRTLLVPRERYSTLQTQYGPTTETLFGTFEGPLGPDGTFQNLSTSLTIQ